MAKVMISLPADFLRKVDWLARAEGRSRSELIRDALRAHMLREAPHSGVRGRRTRGRAWMEALAPLRELEQQWVGQWDSTEIIRYYRDRRYGREDRR